MNSEQKKKDICIYIYNIYISICVRIYKTRWQANDHDQAASPILYADRYTQNTHCKCSCCGCCVLLLLFYIEIYLVFFLCCSCSLSLLLFGCPTIQFSNFWAVFRFIRTRQSLSFVSHSCSLFFSLRLCLPPPLFTLSFLTLLFVCVCVFILLFYLKRWFVDITTMIE